MLLRLPGISHAMADHAWNALDNHIYGFTLQVSNSPVDPSEYREAAQSFLPMIPADKYPYLRALSEQLIDGAHNGLQDFTLSLTASNAPSKTVDLQPVPLSA